MTLCSMHEWTIVEAIAGIGYCNPFLEGRIERERRALGDDYIDVGARMAPRPGATKEEVFPNMPAMRRRTWELSGTIRSRLVEGCEATTEELRTYEDLVLYRLYRQFMSAFDGVVARSLGGEDWDQAVPEWHDFVAEFQHFLELPGRRLPSGHRPEVIFAGFFQIERAFTLIFRNILGASGPTARLRAAVWESIFTRDMRRYLRVLYERMGDLPTLIVGPSGSGKELVARAIALARYIPFDVKNERFEASKADLYVPLNLSALAPTLVESELFGHIQGAFTGAVSDRVGYLESCGAYGAVFLDEIGELDGAIQVKLLRVLESRRFQRVGSTKEEAFKGKLIAATNRDLGAEMLAGRFRPDLYYRLCADQVTTPSLAEQLADREEDLVDLVGFILRRIFRGDGEGEDDAIEGGADAAEVEALTAEVVDWIGRNLGRHYPWPGNFRELGQCVRNVMIRGYYRPPAARDPDSPVDELARQVRDVELSWDALLGRYYALALHRSGTFASAGERIGADWKTVKTRHDRAFLDRLRGGPGAVAG